MLRDKFAMAAMQGELAGQREGCEWSNEQYLASRAYEIADAMMKERAKWNFDDDHEEPTGYIVSDSPISRKPVPPDVQRPPIKTE